MSACLLVRLHARRGAHARGSRAGAAAVSRLCRLARVDLCFQGFERELAELPGCYAPPAGRLLIARVGGDVVGCVGLRPLEPGVCEMKRLWVEPGFAGHGIGRALAESDRRGGAEIGYERMRLDTIPERMPAAQHLYAALGFREIPPYYHNPLAGVVMLELTL